MEIKTETGLKEALNLMESGNPKGAQEMISTLFENDLECKELIYTNRCCTYWLDSIRRIKAVEDSCEKSDKILAEWKTIFSFLEKDKSFFPPAQFAVQKGFFKNALEEYMKLLDEKDPLQRAEIFRKTGICYKKLGDFENALAFLKEANVLSPKCAAILSELADCYALCGDDRYGKVLFREAFFLGPEDIDLDFLDSQLIKCLISKTEEKGYLGKTLHYWIPVYGVLCGVFNIKRELNSQEVAKLKKNIFAMENEYKDPDCNAEILVPKLLNSYFWQIDHYVLSNEKIEKINEVLLKIKILDSSIHEQYVK